MRTSVVAAEADRNFLVADPDIERNFVFLVVALETKHQHAERFEREAPDNAEGIRFAEQIDVAAAQRRWWQSAAA